MRERLGGKGIISSVSGYALRFQSGAVVIDSDDVTVSSDFGAVSVFKGADVTINGGTFDSGYSNGGIDTICRYGWSNTENKKAVINLNGGTYHKYNPTTISGTKFNNERVATDNGDGSWTVA